MDRLLEFGLLEYDQNGSLRKKYDNTTSKNDAFKTSPHRYFEQVSELAKRGALLDSSMREFQCFSLAINSQDLPKYKELVRNFRAKLCNLAEPNAADQVFQVNLQMFPLTNVSMEHAPKIDHSLDLNFHS